ncbi:Aste57867_11050 [Aphanomyces stellatus]|uniref:Aste57867_11050 protein n=1 Tax=Aphanomyces stellatus TaxID=120398 RepID=A0A485KT38_9STRA|nr:hypothetical protein As57867_011008 [Aphanomyces stellatus]VFT87918.1 Aste57867_11050 [Aphanomyces stellatus]
MYRQGIKAFSSIPLPKGYSIYDNARPDYPIHAFFKLKDFLHRSDRPHSALYDVVEIGAGQGKLTRALKRALPKHTRFAAVEADADLRTEFQHFISGVPVFDGSASNTSLPDESVCNIAIGHSFHYMESKNALDEFHRILVPNGRLGIMLNKGDFNVCPFMQEVERILKSFNAAYVPNQSSRELEDIFHERPFLFTPMQSERISTVHSASVDGIVNYLMSTCVISNLSHRRQTDVRLSISRLIETNPDVRIENGQHMLDLPCEVEFHWVEKREVLSPLSVEHTTQESGAKQSC